MPVPEETTNFMHSGRVNPQKARSYRAPCNSSRWTASYCARVLTLLAAMIMSGVLYVIFRQIFSWRNPDDELKTLC